MLKNLLKAQLPFFVIVTGIAFTLGLQLLIPEGVFFSGDAGLKALLTKQLSQGIWRFDLIPPDLAWVKSLWQADLYPYEPPFAYYINQKYYITFPFTFPLITAPLQALFGYRGLYIIPLVSTWIIWFIFAQVCRHFKVNNFYTSLGLATLIFAAPLTIYSAMYWEHSLAVALCFAGIAILLLKYPKNLSILAVISSSILIGLSVWFRPEFLCAIGVLFLLMAYSSIEKILNFKNSQFSYLSDYSLVFIAFTTVTVALFFLCNKIIYTHPLGVHALQIVDKAEDSQRLLAAFINFKQMGKALFVYLPITFFPIGYIIYKSINRQINIKLAFIYLSIILFIIGVAIIVPVGTAGSIPGGKQWGVRFLLILVPIIILLATTQLQSLNKFFALIVFTLLLVVGIHKNTYQATQYLTQTYQGVEPAINFLNNNPNLVIAVSHQYAAQNLEPSVENKIFFRVNNPGKMKQLITSLNKQNIAKFIYVCYPFRECNLPKNKSQQIKFNFLGKFGKYPIYEGKIE